MLISLIYGSTATNDMTDHDLLELLNTSEANNSSLGVTGMLLYRDGNFLQVLEGEEEVVNSLYQRIATDPRHRSVMTIFKRSIPKREFADWRMGFVNISNLNSEDLPSGYSNFLEQPIDANTFADRPSYAYTFMKHFKDMAI